MGVAAGFEHGLAGGLYEVVEVSGKGVEVVCWCWLERFEVSEGLLPVVLKLLVGIVSC